MKFDSDSCNQEDKIVNVVNGHGTSVCEQALTITTWFGRQYRESGKTGDGIPASTILQTRISSESARACYNHRCYAAAGVSYEYTLAMHLRD